MSPPIRARPLQPADLSAVEDLADRGALWEPVRGQWQTLFELEGRIVGACSRSLEQIARPIYVPEPIPELATPFLTGPHLALVGTGLVVELGLPPTACTLIHRLARTLRSQEAGAHWSLLRATLPTIDGLEAAHVVQQIAFGAVDWSPVIIPLLDGYWPIGVHDGDAVLVRFNDI